MVNNKIRIILSNISYSIITIIFLLFLHNPLTHAKQVREVVSNDEMLFNISANDITRISVENDKISTLQVKSGLLKIVKNTKLGEAYITPRKKINKSINLFISTKKGFVYKLLLVPKNIPSAQIILRNKSAYISSGIVSGVSNEYERRITDIVIAMQKDMAIDNCMISQVNKKINSPVKYIKLRAVKKYSCNRFNGYKVKILNKNNNLYSEKDFVTPKTSAVKLYKNYLLILNRNDIKS